MNMTIDRLKHDPRCVCVQCSEGRKKIAAARIADGAMRRLIRGDASTVAEALQASELEYRQVYGDPGARIPRALLDTLNVKVRTDP